MMELLYMLIYLRSMYRNIHLSLEWLIGRVVEIYSPMERNVGGRTTRLIDFVIEDADQSQLRCTVWDDHVDKMLPFYKSSSMETVNLLVQLCRARILDNGEVRISSSFDATKLWFNHNSQEFDSFVGSLPSDCTPISRIKSESRLSAVRPVRSYSTTEIVVTSIEEIYRKRNMRVFHLSLAPLTGRTLLYRIVMKNEQVESLHSPFAVLEIVKDSGSIAKHCGGERAVCLPMLCDLESVNESDEEFFAIDGNDVINLADDSNEVFEENEVGSMNGHVGEECTQGVITLDVVGATNMDGFSQSQNRGYSWRNFEEVSNG